MQSSKLRRVRRFQGASRRLVCMPNSVASNEGTTTHRLISRLRARLHRQIMQDQKIMEVQAEWNELFGVGPKPGQAAPNWPICRGSRSGSSDGSRSHRKHGDASEGRHRFRPDRLCGFSCSKRRGRSVYLWWNRHSVGFHNPFREARLTYVRVCEAHEIPGRLGKG